MDSENENNKKESLIEYSNFKNENESIKSQKSNKVAPEIEIINNKKKEEEKKPNSVSFFKLQFSLLDKQQIIIVTIAIIACLLVSTSMPLFSLVFGNTINDISGPNFMDALTKKCLSFIYLGIFAFVTGTINIGLWNYNGKVIARRFKEEYFRLIMSQEQAYFDQTNTFEYATKIQTQTKAVDSGVNYNYFNINS